MKVLDVLKYFLNKWVLDQYLYLVYISDTWCTWVLGQLYLTPTLLWIHINDQLVINIVTTAVERVQCRQFSNSNMVSVRSCFTEKLNVLMLFSLLNQEKCFRMVPLHSDFEFANLQSNIAKKCISGYSSKYCHNDTGLQVIYDLA